MPAALGRLQPCADADTLIRAALSEPAYALPSALALERVARGKLSSPWGVRVAAALMLQRQLLFVPRHDWQTHDFWLVRLGLKPSLGADVLLKPDVLQQGFSSRELRRVLPEWLRYLARLHGLEGSPCRARDRRAILRLTQCECRVALARFCFTADEVVDEIRRRVRLSKGEVLPWAEDGAFIEEEVRTVQRGLPRYERRIVELLCRPGEIHWVSDAPSRAANALVQYPPGAVVLTVNPPGSTLELELKRAGQPGPRPLSVVYTRDERDVPASHRLHAGSMAWHLRYEARATARFRRIYALVHGDPPVMSMTHTLKSIRTVPAEPQPISLIEFLHSEEIFAADYAGMRHALDRTVRDNAAHDDSGKDLPGELGKTFNFLMQTWPAQAVQSHTAALRLDRLVGLLAASPGAGPAWEAEQALEEMLGSFVRPIARARTPAALVRTVLAANRAHADRVFTDLCRQLGAFWGTLAGVKGYSNGECFVARNIGLRCAWLGGAWQPRLHFMDHDDLHLPHPDAAGFEDLAVLRGMTHDQAYIVGDPQRPALSASVRALRQAYAPSEAVARRALVQLRQARTAALRQTTRRLQTCIPLRDHFSPIYLQQAAAFDQLCTAFRGERTRLLATPGALGDFLRARLPEAREGRIKQYAAAFTACASHFLLDPRA